MVEIAPDFYRGFFFKIIMTECNSFKGSGLT
jgi:hypothetical protein